MKWQAATIGYRDRSVLTRILRGDISILRRQNRIRISFRVRGTRCRLDMPASRLRCAGLPTIAIAAGPRYASMPPERSAVLRWKLASSASPPPLDRMWRKSERCTATRLIEPAASTSTTFQPAGVWFIT